MRISFSLLGIVLFLIISAPVYADDALDFIDEEIGEWTTIANDNGYPILETLYGMIGEDDVSIMFELTPGTYRFYSSGGLHVNDIDLFINDKDGEVGRDTMSDKIPIVAIILDETTCIEALVTVWEFEEGYEEDYYCLQVTCETEGELLTCSENWHL